VGSLKEFRHSKAFLELTRMVKLGRKRTSDNKLKIALANTQAWFVIVTINKTDEKK